MLKKHALGIILPVLLLCSVFVLVSCEVNTPPSTLPGASEPDPAFSAESSPADEDPASSAESSPADEDPASSAEPSPADDLPDEYIDRTVPFETFDPADFPSVIQSVSDAEFEEIYADVSRLFSAADHVVYGTVQAVAYWDLSGSAHIVYTFAVRETLKGDVPPHTLLSVLTPGGYCRLESYIRAFGDSRFQGYTEEDIRRTVIHACFNRATDVPETGDSCLLFLSGPLANAAPFPDGVYVEKGAFQGRLVEREDGSFRRVIPDKAPDYYGDAKTVWTKEEIVSFAR